MWDNLPSLALWDSATVATPSLQLEPRLTIWAPGSAPRGSLLFGVIIGLEGEGHLPRAGNLSALSHLILTTTLRGWWYYYPHYTDSETEALPGETT